MATTRDRLILSQLVYEDMRLLKNQDDIGSAANVLVLGEVLKKLKTNDGTSAITMNELKAVLGEWMLVDAVNLKNLDLTQSEQENGFYSAMYKNINTGELVYAIRGSDPGLTEWEKIKENPQLWVEDWINTNMGELPLSANKQNQFSRAIMAEDKLKDFLKTEYGSGVTKPLSKVTASNLSITGHSMGGALAQRIAVNLYDETGKAFVTETFNAPGQLHGLTDAQKALNANGIYQITNYVNQDDFTGTMDLIPREVFSGASVIEVALLAAAISTGNTILISAVALFLDSNAGRALNAVIAQNLTNPEYAAQFMKHVGKTQYMPGDSVVKKYIDFTVGGTDYTRFEVTENSHGLMNFFQYITYNGNLSPDKATSITLDDGKDYVLGTTKDDEIDLGAGDDWIQAGKGKDVIWGRDGNDTYIYRIGDGSDTIHDYGRSNYVMVPNSGALDTLVLKDINMSQVRAERTDFDLILKFDYGSESLNTANSNDSITIIKYFTMIDGHVPIEKISFNGETVNFKEWFISSVGGNGTNLVGSNRDNLIIGYKGNDTIDAQGGADVIYGGEDDDIIYGGDDNDRIQGGKGNDILKGDLNINGIVGTESKKNDTYVYNFGDGQDTIIDSVGVETLVLNMNSLGSTSVYRLNKDIVIDFSDGGKLTLLNQYKENEGSILGTGYIEYIQFANKPYTLEGVTTTKQMLSGRLKDIKYFSSLFLDDSTLSKVEEFAALNLDKLVYDNGSIVSAFDSLSKPWGIETLKLNIDTSLLSEVSSIMVHRLVNQIQYNSQKWLMITDANDRNNLKSLNDDLRNVFRSMGANVIFDSSGKTWIDGKLNDIFANLDPNFGMSGWSYDDLFYGSNGSNKLDGGGGNDFLAGGGGNDTLLGGWGDDWMLGDDGNDLLDGYKDNDSINGGNGDDVLNGGEGNDVLIGGLGDDSIEGSFGNNFFFYNLGDGMDKMIDFWSYNSANRLVLGDGILKDDFFLTRNRNDFTLKFNNGNDGVSFTNFFWNQYIGWNTDNRMEQIIFSDGEIWGAGDIKKATMTYHASENGSMLQGFSDQNSNVDEIFIGHNGDDTIWAYEGDDLLIGGKGDDTLVGGYGSDVYQFSSGDGHDTIRESGFNYPNPDAIIVDSIVFTDIGSNDVELKYDHEDLVISYNNAMDSINLMNQRSLGIKEIHKIVFSNGISWNSNDIKNELMKSVVRNGSESNDFLQGNDGSDVIYGDSGDDVLEGNQGDDTLCGGSGNDTIYGNEGDDTICGGNGNDILVGGYGKDTYVFNRGFGKDILHSTVFGFDSNEKSDDTIQFLDGIKSTDISIEATALGETILSLVGTLDSLNLKSLLNVYDEIEYIKFADGIVWDRAYLKSLRFVIDGSNGNDNIFDSGLSNVLIGNEGDDWINGNDGDDIICGGIGNDRLNGGMGSDVYEYSKGFGHDYISEYAYSEGGFDKGIDKISFLDIRSDEVFLNYYNSDLIIRTYYGTDQITIENYLSQSTYRLERIEFSDGVEWNLANESLKIAVNDQNDEIKGIDTNEILLSDNRNNVLSGGMGSDVYRFSRGFGQDIVSDKPWNNNIRQFDSGIDIIELVDIASYEVELTYYNEDLILSVIGSQDQIQILGYKSSIINRINSISFSDGVVWDTRIIEELCPGANLNDYLEGTYEADFINSDTGDDYVNGKEGNDEIYGVDGNDALFGDWGNDYISGGSGDDNISGGYGLDILDGGIGNDELEGGDGEDILIGGHGDDNLRGGNDGDNYTFDKGFGSDVIYEYGSSSSSVQGNIDRVQFGLGLYSKDIQLSYNENNDLIIKFFGMTDKLTVNNFKFSDTIESFEFADGAIWSSETIREMVEKNGDGNYFGSDGDDILDGGSGDDQLFGYDGNDIMIGGKGNDYLEGGKGEDKYQYGVDDGNDVYALSGTEDQLILGAGVGINDLKCSISIDGDYILNIKDANSIVFKNWIDGNKLGSIIFEDGTTLTTVHIEKLFSNSFIGSVNSDKFLGLGEGEVIIGGKGNDDLKGGIGNDAYYFRKGDGQDIIYDNDSTINNLDTLVLGEGLLTSDVQITSNGLDLIIGFAGLDDQITIKSYFSSNRYKVENIQFYDGTVWDTETISNMSLAITGTESNNTLYGTVVSNVMNGMAGDDKIYGFAGDDVISGGIGNDYLQGAAGNDQYIFNLGDGQDIISDSDVSVGNIDTLVLGEGLLTSDVQITSNGLDLIIGFAGLDDQITIKSYFSSNRYKVENIQFYDGTVWDTETISNMSLALTGTELNNTLYGTAAGNVMNGMAGDDKIYGFEGDDVIIGGIGNDYLQGAAGNDQYIFNLGDGQDIINDLDATIGNIDTLVLGEGFVASDVEITSNGLDLIIGFAGLDDEITIKSYLSSNRYKVENIQFYDGTVWDTETISNMSLAITGTESNNTLYGTTAGNVMNGMAGDDKIYGFEGDDVIIGGFGNDYLQGAAGNDQYVFGTGFGNDTISNANSTLADFDVAKFDFDKSQLVLNRVLNSLEIKIAGHADSVSIQNWYKTQNSKLESIEDLSGAGLLMPQVDQLIQAMATFSAQSGITWEQAAQEGNQQYIEIINSYYTSSQV